MATAPMTKKNPYVKLKVATLKLEDQGHEAT